MLFSIGYLWGIYDGFPVRSGTHKNSKIYFQATGQLCLLIANGKGLKGEPHPFCFCAAFWAAMPCSILGTTIRPALSTTLSSVQVIPGVATCVSLQGQSRTWDSGPQGERLREYNAPLRAGTGPEGAERMGWGRRPMQQGTPHKVRLVRDLAPSCRERSNLNFADENLLVPSDEGEHIGCQAFGCIRGVNI